MTSIHERPVEVEERLVPGHWEGDLIQGARNASAIGTLVERTTLFVTLAKMENASAEAAVAGFGAVLNRIEAQCRLSMTYDQGREMAQHERLAEMTGIAVYFADPHSPWQRGINEHTNGLLRQYFPKGTNLSDFSQAQLDAVAWQLNSRPRKSLGWKCPAELFMPNHLWREELAGVVVESTYNWYWLMDGLQEAGFAVKLANTGAIRKYDGLKHSGDEADALHLAHLLRSGILPTGTILPPEHRVTRDLAVSATSLL